MRGSKCQEKVWATEVQSKCDGGVSEYLCVCHGGGAQEQSYSTPEKDLENRKER